MAAFAGLTALFLGAAATLGWSGAPSWLQNAAAILLWGLAGLFYFGVGVAIFVQGGRVPEQLRDWEARRQSPTLRPRKIVTVGRRVFQIAFIGLLILADQWVLAGLFLVTPLMMDAQGIGFAIWVRGIERPKINRLRWVSYRVIKVIVGAVGWIMALPFVLCALAWDYVSGRRLARDLRNHFGHPDGFAYFLYSEPHQHAAFLEEGGVLEPFAERIVARDWRKDIKAQSEDFGWLEFRETPEGRLLGNLEVTNLYEDLPLVVLVAPGRKPEAFHLNKAYRQRLRDKGEALARLERKIARALAEIFPAPGEPTT